MPTRRHRLCASLSEREAFIEYIRSYHAAHIMVGADGRTVWWRDPLEGARADVGFAVAPNEPVAVIVEKGDRCIYCDRASEGGERWLKLDDPCGWLICNPTCYGRLVEDMGAHERDTAPQARARFVDAFTAAYKVLAAAGGIIVGKRGDALLRELAIARANES